MNGGADATASGPGAAGGRVIRIAAASIVDADGRMLVVRKHGTDAFMQPGGKLEPGESPAEALVRELAEELDLALTPGDLAHLGRFDAPAANEAGHVVDCDVYRVLRDAGRITVQAELAEARWCGERELRDLASRGLLAPLTRDNLTAFLGGAATGQE